MTDHRVYFEGGNIGGLLVLSGEEFMYMDKERRTAYHIVGVDLDGHFETDGQTPPQTVADGIIARGGIAVMGHPAWSLMSHTDILEVRGISALEVYSGVSEEYTARGDSTEIADLLAARGARYSAGSSGPLRARGQQGWNRGRRKHFTLVPSFHMTGRAFFNALPATGGGGEWRIEE